MELYTVQPGDNLWKISTQFGVQIQKIIDINGLNNPNELVVGMVLVIPIDRVNNAFTYSVEQGDTLWAIGQKFNVDYIEIARTNNLYFPSNLLIGQQLKISISQKFYTVKPGDTLWIIAQRNNVSINRIITLNNLTNPYIIYPGQVLVMDTIKPTIETLGYYNPSRVTDKALMIRELGRYLTYLGVFDFPMTESGRIDGVMDVEVLQAASEQNVALLPVITNLRFGNFDRELAYSVISNNDTLNIFIDSILELLEQYNLKGVVVDIENMAPSDRSVFTRFIRLLYEELKENNKILILNLPAKWEEWEDKDWVGFFDYNALSQYIDRAAIMTYEFGWSSGPPRATVPIDYITRTLNYAIENNIPSSKILLGMTLYGYDWGLPDTAENLADTVTLPEVWDLARRYNGRINFDFKEQQSYVDYIDDGGNIHKVWFESARGHYLKYKLVMEYNLRGVFYWIINLPFKSTWYMLSELFNIKKIY